MKDDLSIGAIGSHFKTLAIPAALGMLFTTLYNVVDVYYAGQLSTDAQAGMAIGYQALFILMALGFGLGSVLSALVSKAKGAKDRTATLRFITQGISFSIILTLLLMLVGAISGPNLIALVSEPGAYRDSAEDYFGWLIYALPGFFIAYGSNGVLQAHADSLSMQRAMVVSFFANVGLNPLFMFGIPGIWDGIGLAGIAVATIVSQTGVMVYLVSRVFSLDIMRSVPAIEFKPDWATYRSITAQLLPASSALFIMFLSGFVVQFALKGFGGSAIAAYGVALRIEQILLLPILGMTGALLPIVGQNFGAGNFERVRQSLFFCWKAGFIMSLIAMVILWFFGSFAMSLFTKDAAVIAIGTSYLRVDGFLFPVYMVLFSLNSYLQALQRPIWTLWISIYRQGFGVAFFIWIFVGVLGFDVWGVWFGIATAVTTGCALALNVANRVSHRKVSKVLF